MTGILGKFHVEHGIHGAKVMTRTHQLTGDCIADDEIDTAIQMLKDDLDACAGDETPPRRKSTRFAVRRLAFRQRRYRGGLRRRSRCHLRPDPFCIGGQIIGPKHAVVIAIQRYGADCGAVGAPT